VVSREALDWEAMGRTGLVGRKVAGAFFLTFWDLEIA
jgi:hypothetical protein